MSSARVGWDSATGPARTRFEPHTADSAYTRFDIAWNRCVFSRIQRFQEGEAISGFAIPIRSARPGPLRRTPPLPRRASSPTFILILRRSVFCGGAIGTAIRYAFAGRFPGAAGSFHTGTFVANMLACFCYAGLTAYLAGASRFGARSKELASRGLGMGVCGGLSTMSTLALEGFTAIRDGQVAAGIADPPVTFALGLVCASAGVWAGTHLAGSSNVSAEASADTNAATTSKGGKA